MCVICGCNEMEPKDGIVYRRHVHGQGHAHDHRHAHEHGHAHDHARGHPHEHPQQRVEPDPASGDLHFGAGVAGVSVPGLSQARAVRIEQDVLGENNRHARANRAHFLGHGILALNLVSSPGSGKTTLLCATVAALRARRAELPVAVIEGDQQTSNDAERIRASGAPAIQVNTGKGCHLDALMVGQAFGGLPLHSHDDHGRPGEGGILFIENVGNLVCPAMWDLGEAAKVVILSVTEGEDKPLKYPDMFAAATLMILNKTDLLPHLRFDVAACVAFARRVNPGITVIELSAESGQGMDVWLDWLVDARARLAEPGAAAGGSAA